MSFSVTIPLFIFTWSKERVKYVTLSGCGLPKIQYSGDAKSFHITVSDYLSESLASTHRVHYQQLDAVPLLCNTEIAIPYLVLCKEDNFKTGVELVDVERIFPDSLRYGWNDATQNLIELIGGSTACLNMLPDVFNNLHIRLIHNQIIGNVNRATLRKRFEDTGFVLPTGNKIQTKKGMPPNEMRIALQKLYFFGAHLSTTN